MVFTKHSPLIFQHFSGITTDFISDLRATKQLLFNNNDKETDKISTTDIDLTIFKTLKID